MDACIATNSETVVQRCMGRVRHWRTPPNWSTSDWLKEATAQATLAALSRRQTGRSIGGGVDSDDDGTAKPSYGHVLGSVLTRYRQEWSYARHCSRFGAYESPAAEPGDGESAELIARLEPLVKKLPEPDQLLIHQLYWENRTEAQIAEHLGVSQQAVNKHKRRLLSQLAIILSQLFITLLCNYSNLG